ncbi:SRPBCC domain-containing protein [Nonomuraea sp. NPDC050394]|uniref:SRPBCC domain-containing protein n=1 Tax=Nonomuraea sp. NPDC050394 TaxID=3364363 RepID=UPI0037A4FE67
MVTNTIEREVVLRHSVERVWAALTTAEGLSRWFGSVAEIDLRPGGRAYFRWDDLGQESLATVTAVEAPHRFAFTWATEGVDVLLTTVEFTLEEVPGGTRLRLVESGFARAAAGVARSAHQANSQGWDAELADLESYLDAAA